jgi:hypothetical protein
METPLLPRHFRWEIEDGLRSARVVNIIGLRHVRV